MKEILRWENFKNLFQITIFRYLVVWFSFVPVLAKILEALPKEVKLQTASDFTVAFTLSLPFDWQILWLSSLFFLSAWVIYMFRCPRFIKKYNNYSDYLAYGHDPRWLVWEAKSLLKVRWYSLGARKNIAELVERLETKKYLECFEGKASIEKFEFNKPLVCEKQTKIYFESDKKLYCLAMPVTEDNDAERGIFWEVFARFSGSRTWSRIFICGLLLISALLFVFVLLQHIYEGMSYVSTWLKIKAII